MPGKSQSYSDAVLNILRGISITGYARQAVVFGAPVTDTGNLRKISNTNNIQFGPAAADWPQAVAFGVFDVQSSGNLLYWNTLATPKTIQQGDFGQFAPGSLIVEED